MGIKYLLKKLGALPEIVVALIASVVSLIVHRLPFILYSEHPLGYDTGFYRRYLIQPFVGFPNSAVPGLGDDAIVPRLFLDILRQTHLPPDTLLYGSYLVCLALLPLLAFFILRSSLGVRGAFIGALLLALSPVSYTAFWFMLWKNAWALCLLLGAFIALEQRALWWVIALEIGIALSHKTTAILYLLTLGVLILLNRERWKEYALHLAITGLAFFAVNFSLPTEIIRSAPSAVFLGWSEYITLSVPFVVAAFVGIFFWKKTAIPKSLLAFALAGIAFPLFQLPFYERVFVFVDVSLVLLSAFGVEFIIQKIREDGWRIRSSLYILLLCAIVGILLGSLENQVKSLRPLISDSDIARIQSIGNIVPRDATLLTTTDEAPWFEGFTLNHIAAPGMLNDNHNVEEWTAFWESTSTNQRIKFLNSFPQPLYSATLSDFNDLIGAPITCLETLTPSLRVSECDK